MKVHDALNHRRPHRRVRTVTVKCPFCRCRHVHGWPGDQPDPGVRVSHCHVDAQAYRIVVAS